MKPVSVRGEFEIIGKGLGVIVLFLGALALNLIGQYMGVPELVTQSLKLVLFGILFGIGIAAYFPVWRKVNTEDREGTPESSAEATTL